MNYVLERMKKSRMLALFLVLSMVLSLMPVNMASATQGGEPANTGDILIETSEAQNGKVFYSFDGQRLQQTPLP